MVLEISVANSLQEVIEYNKEFKHIVISKMIL